VLIVPDRGRASAVREALTAEGALRVNVAPDFDAALERLRTGPFDAVVCDIETADAADASRLRTFREAAPDVSLIVIASVQGEAVQELKHVADEFLTWHGSAPAIAAHVRGVVERARLSAALESHEAELAAAEERFRSIIQRTADGFVILSEEGRIEFVNPAAERMFGRSAAEMVGQEFGFPVVNGETTEMDIVRPGEKDTGVVAELRVNSTTWDGERALIVSLRDVTDRKRAEERTQRLILEQAAREQAEQAGLRAKFLAEASSVLDSSLDPDATLLSLARLIVPRLAEWCVIDLVEDGNLRRVAGVHGDAEKQPLLEELKERFRPTADSPQPSVRVARTGEAEVYRGLTPDRIRELAVDEAHADLLQRLGTRSSMTLPLRARGHVIGAITFVCDDRDFDEADVGLAEEIATRAARAIENARLYEAALAANRSKSNFLAVMSHELRTPLNAIIGYTEILLGGISGELTEEQRKQLGRVHTSADHLLQLIEEILTFAQMETGNEHIHPSDALLSDIVDQVLAIAEPLARDRGLVLHVRAPAADAMLFTDARKLRQIMLNLLSNAFKFTNEGSVTFSTTLSGDDLIVDITDTGIGIEPDDLNTIFRPFWQAEGPLTRHAGGTGLGLSVSRRLAELLGGTITVTSEPGVGSTFTLRVPATIAGPRAGR
jgi:PAS domain S-box-containing protein